MHRLISIVARTLFALKKTSRRIDSEEVRGVQEIETCDVHTSQYFVRVVRAVGRDSPVRAKAMHGRLCVLWLFYSTTPSAAGDRTTSSLRDTGTSYVVCDRENLRRNKVVRGALPCTYNAFAA